MAFTPRVFLRPRNRMQGRVNSLMSGIKRLTSIVQQLRGATRAAAAVEVAIAFPVLFLFFAGMVDLGMANLGRSRLNNAVGAGSHYAFLTGKNVTAANIKTVVENLADMRTSSNLPLVTANVTGPSCFCVTGSGGTLAMVATACTALCADSTRPSLYVSINATYPYTPMLPAISTFMPASFTAAATVQLQ